MIESLFTKIDNNQITLIMIKSLFTNNDYDKRFLKILAPVVQRADNFIQRIKLSVAQSADSLACNYRIDFIAEYKSNRAKCSLDRNPWFKLKPKLSNGRVCLPRWLQIACTLID